MQPHAASLEPHVTVILDKLPGLLHSLPSSVNPLIVHVGWNDTARQQSELTKDYFEKLFHLLRSCEKSGFISGLIPTLAAEQGVSVGSSASTLGSNPPAELTI